MRRILLVAALLLTACSTAPRPARQAGSWIFTKQALEAVIASPAARARLAGARIFEILKPGERPTTAVPVVPTESFKSYSALAGTIESGRLPGGIRAVIYDAEHWAQTPTGEQRDPVAYYRKAAAVAHAHGLIFVATPAMDLVNASGKQRNAAAAFLSDRIDGAVARYADVLDIQSQSLEGDASAYRDFVAQAAGQARSANAAVTVIAGLSTHPHGPTVTAAMLAADMAAVADTTTGFWLNIPDQGCTACATARPDIAVAALSGQ